MNKWSIGILVLVVGLGSSALPAGDSQAIGLLYNEPSGYWANPTLSDLCLDTERCVEWHDDGPGGRPRILCCVEVARIPYNLLKDCRQRFVWYPR